MFVKTFTATAIIALLVAFPLFLIRHKPNMRRPLNDYLYDIDDLMV